MLREETVVQKLALLARLAPLVSEEKGEEGQEEGEEEEEEGEQDQKEVNAEAKVKEKE